MAEHPIESLMITAMTSLRDMIDVNTIVGDCVTGADGTLVIPVSKVCFGFASGGSEFNTNKLNKFSEEAKLPFGGGSGAGVNITPSAFIIVKNGNVRVVNMNMQTPIDKVLDMAPDIMDKINVKLKEKKKDNKILTFYDNPEE